MMVGYVNKWLVRKSGKGKRTIRIVFKKLCRKKNLPQKTRRSRNAESDSEDSESDSYEANPILQHVTCYSCMISIKHNFYPNHSPIKFNLIPALVIKSRPTRFIFPITSNLLPVLINFRRSLACCLYPKPAFSI